MTTLKLAQIHDNIVQFIDFEKKHLIMEFCNESLDNVLKLKKNGLPSDEIMVFTAQFFAGLKHLRKFNIIHRDIKPGNILVSHVNGNDVFKIADFGAARILLDDETYTSLYGTAEYSHPDTLANFYRQLLEIVPRTNIFSSKHEIWSIAVTIFEVATGHLPFEPKLGRKNLKLQYKMMTNKKREDICAKEMENGQIEWYSQLPEECEIEKTVKVALELLLADMLKVRFS